MIDCCRFRDHGFNEGPGGNGGGPCHWPVCRRPIKSFFLTVERLKAAAGSSLDLSDGAASQSPHDSPRSLIWPPAGLLPPSAANPMRASALRRVSVYSCSHRHVPPSFSSRRPLPASRLATNALAIACAHRFATCSSLQTCPEPFVQATDSYCPPRPCKLRPSRAFAPHLFHLAVALLHMVQLRPQRVKALSGPRARSCRPDRGQPKSASISEGLPAKNRICSRPRPKTEIL